MVGTAENDLAPFPEPSALRYVGRRVLVKLSRHQPRYGIEWLTQETILRRLRVCKPKKQLAGHTKSIR